MVKLKVFKFNPVKDSAPRFVEYSAPLLGQTLLEALLYVLEKHDPELSFRYGCGGSGADQRCGSCALLANRKPVLACKEVVRDKRIVLEPHPKFRIVKDLIADFSLPREKRIKDTKPELLPTIDSERCTGCGVCVMTCPVQVFSLKRERIKRVAVVSDPGSCCGNSCLQCVIYCAQNAVFLEPRREKAGEV